MPRTQSRTVYIVVTFLLVALASSNCVCAQETAKKPAKPPPPSSLVIEPQLGLCTLEIGNQTLKPMHTASPWPRHQWVGDLRIALEKRRVVGWRGLERQSLWSVDSK